MEAQPTQKLLQGAKTRAECLSAATEVFARRGYTRTTMAEIAAAAGVTKGTLYWHYRTKEEFLVAALRKLNTEWEGEVLAGLHPGKSADELIADTFERTINLNERSPWVNRFFITVALDAENIHPDAVTIMREIGEKNRAFFSVLIERGREEGIFRKQVEPARAAAALAAGYSGTLVAWYIDPAHAELRTAMRDFYRTVLAGLASSVPRGRKGRP